MSWKDDIREVAEDIRHHSEHWLQFLGAKLLDEADQMSTVDGVDYCWRCGREIIDCPCEMTVLAVGIASDYLPELRRRNERIDRLLVSYRLRAMWADAFDRRL